MRLDHFTNVVIVGCLFTTTPTVSDWGRTVCMPLPSYYKELDMLTTSSEQCKTRLKSCEAAKRDAELDAPQPPFPWEWIAASGVAGALVGALVGAWVVTR